MQIVDTQKTTYASAQKHINQTHDNTTTAANNYDNINWHHEKQSDIAS